MQSNAIKRAAMQLKEYYFFFNDKFILVFQKSIVAQYAETTWQPIDSKGEGKGPRSDEQQSATS